MQKFNELYKKTQKGKSMNTRIKLMNKGNTLSKQFESLQKNQIKILKLKNSLNEIKDALGSTGNKVDPMEERIRNLEDRNLVMLHIEEERK